MKLFSPLVVFAFLLLALLVWSRSPDVSDAVPAPSLGTPAEVSPDAGTRRGDLGPESIVYTKDQADQVFVRVDGFAEAFAALPEEDKALLKGEKGDRGEKGDKGEALDPDLYYPKQDVLDMIAEAVFRACGYVTFTTNSIGGSRDPYPVGRRFAVADRRVHPRPYLRTADAC